MMTSLCLAALLSVQSGDVVQSLEHQNPEVRMLAARLAGKQRLATAVGRLVRLLDDEAETVRQAAHASLMEITGRNDPADAGVWKSWWEHEGHKAYPEHLLTEPQISEIVAREVQRESDQYVRRVEAAKQEVRFMSVVMGVAVILFLGVMIFFVGNVSSRIKGWRQLVSQAETYLKQGQEITDRADKILAELDAKKLEVQNSFAKLREEHEAEVARYAEIQEQNLEHKLREELMVLRQSAEKELAQTVEDLKTQIEVEGRRALNALRDRLAQ